jgi:chromosomal replication initiation ATPase DnaA
MTGSAASRAPEQLVLELPHRQALGAEDFLVSGSNQAALALVDRWPDWPAQAAIVAGPERSGKSHLVHVWQLKSGAAILSAQDLADASVATAETSPALAVEDIDRGIGDERVLFHLLNLARETRRSILLTSRARTGDIEVKLPDLRSRLRAAPLVEIEPPDEALLKAVLVKLFADRQLAIEPHVVNHLALHMERSIGAAERTVAAADRLALSRGRRVTRALAAEALGIVDETRPGG